MSISINFSIAANCALAFGICNAHNTEIKYNIYDSHTCSTVLEQKVVTDWEDKNNTLAIIPNVASNTSPDDGIFLYMDNAADSAEKSSSELDASLKTLENIRTLQQNWNGNQAEPFSNELVNRVVALVKRLSYQPQIFPTAEDSIQLEFENEKGDYLEFELFEDGKIRKFFYDHENNNDVSWITIGEINDNILTDFFVC